MKIIALLLISMTSLNAKELNFKSLRVDISTEDIKPVDIKSSNGYGPAIPPKIHLSILSQTKYQNTNFNPMVNPFDPNPSPMAKNQIEDKNNAARGIVR